MGADIQPYDQVDLLGASLIGNSNFDIEEVNILKLELATSRSR